MPEPFTGYHLIVQADSPPPAVSAAAQAMEKRFGVRIAAQSVEEAPLPEAGALLVCLLDDARFADLWRRLAEHSVTLLPLPWEGNPLTRAAFGLEENVGELLDLVVESPDSVRQTLTLAEGTPVFTEVRLGQWPQASARPDRWQRFLHALRGLRLSPYDLTTGKGRTVRLAALNLAVGEEAWMTEHHPELAEEEAYQGRVAALVHAPTSRLQLLRRALFPHLLRRHRPPQGMGYVKTRRLSVSSPWGPLAYRLDGRPRQTACLEVEARPTRCKVATVWGPVPKAEDKENLRLNAVPTGEEAVEFFTRRRLPLLPIASEQQFAELFTSLRQAARLRPSFVVLTVLSALLASIGLYQDSGPVIIGAMILAPLMDPIVSLAMGFIRFDRPLLRDSLLSLATGIFLVLALAGLFAASLPLAHLTGEIQARLHPTLLDLGVAVIAGTAAAYAFAKEEVARSLAGVAIAVALVPPLAVSGIGLGLAEGPLFAGAALLFLTNLVGILFAAGATFYLMGFASLRYARLAFLYKFLMVLAVAVPLAFSTRTMVRENHLYQVFREVAPALERTAGVRLELVGVTFTEQGPVARIRLVRQDHRVVDREAVVRRLQAALNAGIELEEARYYARP